jgi:ribosomal protein S18 acetylase RimI-like enzyme
MATSEVGTVILIWGSGNAYDFCKNGRRVGGVNLRSMPGEKGVFAIYITDFIIEPPYRGQGLAKHLLNEIARIAAQKQCNKLKLRVLEANLHAIRIYEKFGFKLVGIKDKYRVYEKQL